MTPRMGSHSLVLWMSSKTLVQMEMKVEPLAWMPRMSFTCVDTMMMATAEVKPEDTGPDTKSMMKPKDKPDFAT